MSRSEEFDAASKRQDEIDHRLNAVRAYLDDLHAPKASGTEPPTLYHGTAHDFGYDLVLPSSALPHGQTKWTGFYEHPDESWRKDRVFAAEGERSAWSWSQGKGRPRVHEVALDDPQQQKFSSGTPVVTGEWHGARGWVKTTHWAPPPKQGDWNQPSISPIDWRSYGGRAWDDAETRRIDREIAEEKKPPTLQPAQFAGQGKLF